MNPRDTAKQLTKNKEVSLADISLAITEHTVTFDKNNSDDQAIMGVLGVALIKATTMYDLTDFTRYQTWKSLLHFAKKAPKENTLECFLDEIF